MDAATKKRINEALFSFWTGRSGQQQQAGAKPQAQGGTRSAVVGGKHLNAVRDLIANEFFLAGIPKSQLATSGRTKVLPGWFRPTKSWDLAVTHGADILALIELKSQVGSFGNNANNRSEEAVGVAYDTDMAFRKRLLGKSRPWLGYVYVVEDSPKSRAPGTRLTNTHYNQRSIFAQPEAFVSYIERFAILGEELVKAGLYQAAWVVTTTSPANGQFGWGDASLAVSYDRFKAAIRKLTIPLGYKPLSP